MININNMINLFVLLRQSPGAARGPCSHWWSPPAGRASLLFGPWLLALGRGIIMKSRPTAWPSVAQRVAASLQPVQAYATLAIGGTAALLHPSATSQFYIFSARRSDELFLLRRDLCVLSGRGSWRLSIGWILLRVSPGRSMDNTLVTLKEDRLGQVLKMELQGLYRGRLVVADQFADRGPRSFPSTVEGTTRSQRKPNTLQIHYKIQKRKKTETKRGAVLGWSIRLCGPQRRERWTLRRGCPWPWARCLVVIKDTRNMNLF